MIIGISILSDPWTGFTQLISVEERPPDRFLVRREIDKKTADIPDQISYGQKLAENGKNAKLKENHKR